MDPGVHYGGLGCETVRRHPPGAADGEGTDPQDLVRTGVRRAMPIARTGTARHARYCWQALSAFTQPLP